MRLTIFTPAFNPDFNSFKQASLLDIAYAVYQQFHVKLHTGVLECIPAKFPRIKYSSQFDRDWLFYDNEHTPKFWWLLISKQGNLLVVPHKLGLTAKECFWLFDSLGMIVPCREPQRLTRAYTSKFSVGITMDNWLSSNKEGVLSRKEIKQYCQSMPSWMYKQFMSRVGQSTSFDAKLHTAKL